MGDFAVLRPDEVKLLSEDPASLSVDRQAELQAKYFLIRSNSAGATRLFKSRLMARHRTVNSGPLLHIIVPTLHCEHTCQYCQVSRSIGSQGVSLSDAQVDAICDTILESPSTDLTVEFQGGDPLLRFDLIERALVRLSVEGQARGKRLSFVIASTLHQLDEKICAVLKEFRVQLSTSIDGPADVHNHNRPLATRDSYQRTVAGMALARELLGPDSVSALATITRAALDRADDLVDEYVRLGLSEICLRPVSPYGFATRGRKKLGLSGAEYASFYRRAILRILEWNRRGYSLREGQAAIALNKMLSPIDAGYVDLQSVPGAGRAALTYNYDGYVYPSDEARMLAEAGNHSLRLGPIGTSLEKLTASPVVKSLLEAGSSFNNETCRSCAFASYCGPDLTEALSVHGRVDVSPTSSEHCGRMQSRFDFLFEMWFAADDGTRNLFLQWAQPRRGP